MAGDPRTRRRRRKTKRRISKTEVASMAPSQAEHFNCLLFLQRETTPAKTSRRPVLGTCPSETRSLVNARRKKTTIWSIPHSNLSLVRASMKILTPPRMKGCLITRLVATTVCMLVRSLSTGMSLFRSSDGAISRPSGSPRISNTTHMWP